MRSVACAHMALVLALLGLAEGAAARVRAVPNEPGLKSSAVLIVDDRTGSPLYSRRSDDSMPIASITKLMTSLVVTEAKQSLSELITISASDREFGKGGFSRLPVGATLSRSDLMHLALMASENRAANALGSHYPGGLRACVAAMNAKAKTLGMSRSHFADATGLSSANRASAEDLVRLVAAAAQVKVIRDFSTDSEHHVRAGRAQLVFHNTDNLVKRSDWNIIVQKTGFTDEAGRCLVMRTMVENRSITMVLLNSFGKYTRVADARRVKNWLVARASERIEHASLR